MLQWLKNLMTGQSLRRKVNLFGLQLSELREEQRRNGRELTTRSKELDIAKEALVLIENRLRETVEEAVRLQKKSQTTVEGLQDQIRTMEELTIPALTESNRLLLERWRAETSVQVGRRALFNQTDSTKEGD